MFWKTSLSMFFVLYVVTVLSAQHFRVVESNNSWTMNFLFGKKAMVREEKKDPSVLAKEWRRNLAKEARSIDRDVRLDWNFWSFHRTWFLNTNTKLQVENLRREEKKALLECKKLAKEGRVSAAKILAKEVIGTRKAVERMLVRSELHESLYNYWNRLWLLVSNDSNSYYFAPCTTRSRKHRWTPSPWYCRLQYVRLE